MSGRVRGPVRARVVDSGAAPWWPAADVAILAAMVTIGSLLLVPTYGGAGAGRRDGAWFADLGGRHRGGAPASGCRAGWFCRSSCSAWCCSGPCWLRRGCAIFGLPAIADRHGPGAPRRGRRLARAADGGGSDRGGRRAAGPAVDHRLGRRRARRGARRDPPARAGAARPGGVGDAVRAVGIAAGATG